MVLCRFRTYCGVKATAASTPRSAHLAESALTTPARFGLSNVVRRAHRALCLLPCPVLPCLAVRSSQSSAEAEREAKKAAARFASTSALDGGGGKRART